MLQVQQQSCCCRVVWLMHVSHDKLTCFMHISVAAIRLNTALLLNTYREKPQYMHKASLHFLSHQRIPLQRIYYTAIHGSHVKQGLKWYFFTTQAQQFGHQHASARS